MDDEPRLHTALCELLSCRYPVVLAPMGVVGTPELTAAVSAAGGFGVLPGMGLPPDELRRQIRETRRLTDRPFGVNLLLHPDLVRPRGASPEAVAAVRALLDGFRERLGLLSPPDPSPPVSGVAASIEVILEERPHLFSVGLGSPPPGLVARFHERGIRVIAMVTTAADAVEVAAAGVDAVVAQGGEAGGHRSSWRGEAATVGTLVLVPEVVRAVRVPVLAAGGIVDGHGVAAALVLGASGAFLGTRFIATRESGAPAFYQRAVVEARSDGTAVTDAFTGLPARVLRNAFVDAYRASGAPVLPAGLQQAARSDLTALGDPEYFPMYAGQGAGLIDDLPAAGEVVRSIVRQASEILRDAPRFAR